jgi:hypothetical protein
MSYLSQPASGRHLVLRPSLPRPRRNPIRRSPDRLPDDPAAVEQPLPRGRSVSWPSEETVISTAVDAEQWPEWTDQPIPYRLGEGRP